MDRQGVNKWRMVSPWKRRFFVLEPGCLHYWRPESLSKAERAGPCDRPAKRTPDLTTHNRLQ